MEKELSAVVRQLPEKEGSGKRECPVCLSNCARPRDGWVVFPCKHGVCSRCFQHLIDTQVPWSAGPCLLCTQRCCVYSPAPLSCYVRSGQPDAVRSEKTFLAHDRQLCAQL